MGWPELLLINLFCHAVNAIKINFHIFHKPSLEGTDKTNKNKVLLPVSTRSNKIMATWTVRCVTRRFFLSWKSYNPPHIFWGVDVLTSIKWTLKHML